MTATTGTLEDASLFKRLILPGLAFKAVVIGGGYATGREIAEFFLPAGPWGGLAALCLATLIWSVVCVVTFLFARETGTRDYRGFFQALLGRGWIVFECAYACFIVLILAVYGAAAGAILYAAVGLAPVIGTLLLMVAIAAVSAFGNSGVERLFAYVSILLYGAYALFLVFALTSFGDRISLGFRSAVATPSDWPIGGITYAGYNIIGAVVILPVTRHFTSSRDAVIAGIAAGPLAMLPAILFFICMCAFLPGISHEVLPSDFLLTRLDRPAFHLLFQLTIFAALLESGTGGVHAINERISAAWLTRRGTALGRQARAVIALALLTMCMLLAQHFGLVALIARGYRLLAGILILVYVAPLLTRGVYSIWTGEHIASGSRDRNKPRQLRG
ncbi:hypothetical protein [Sphingomonas sp. BK580]|uniref:YkvI family membrane protein n=1 Tax=Sphingomonas sp. BK580 TaxID=2586972 RepID=UPI001606F7C4|nr:hypothetical protein [Sphingomonas sp. BK580]MBB3695188.1 putative membrane protein YkvI [Sphingomonas sp. BK580]